MPAPSIPKPVFRYLDVPAPEVPWNVWAGFFVAALARADYTSPLTAVPPEAAWRLWADRSCGLSSLLQGVVEIQPQGFSRWQDWANAMRGVSCVLKV